MWSGRSRCCPLLFLTDPSTTDIYTLSLHDALPISHNEDVALDAILPALYRAKVGALMLDRVDRKSTRLNSSHTVISYAVFCLKKKKFSSSIFCQCPAPGRERNRRPAPGRVSWRALS